MDSWHIMALHFLAGTFRPELPEISLNSPITLLLFICILLILVPSSHVYIYIYVCINTSSDLLKPKIPPPTTLPKRVGHFNAFPAAATGKPQTGNRCCGSVQFCSKVLSEPQPKENTPSCPPRPDSQAARCSCRMQKVYGILITIEPPIVSQVGQLDPCFRRS